MTQTQSRSVGQEFCIPVAVGLWALASGLGGCFGRDAEKSEVPAADLMPPFAVAARPHTGSLAVHSFASEGTDDAPSPSPDGSWLVFVSTRNTEEPQIYRQSSAGPVVTQLTTGPASHIQPVVSPDGREIAYAGNDTGSWDVWIMPAGGGPRENLTSTRDLDEVHPAWHPSGRALAFTSYRSQDRRWWVCAKSRGSSGVTWIAPGLNPNWSPKGGLIAFQRARERGRERGEERGRPVYDIWTAEVAVEANGLVSGGAQSQIVSAPAWSAIEPAFSPDGERIAFVAVPLPKRGGKAGPSPIGGDIWCVRVGGTDLVRLTASPEPDWNPAWAGAPGNRGTNGRVFFASERHGRRNIWSLLPAFYVPGRSGPPGVRTARPGRSGLRRAEGASAPQAGPPDVRTTRPGPVAAPPEGTGDH